MKMHLKGLTALGIACIAWSSHVCALPPVDWQPGRTPVLNVYFSGSTLMDSVLDTLILLPGLGVCQAGTIDLYRVTVANRNNRVIFCRARSGIDGIAANTPIAFHKESIGGSSNGTMPLARQQSLPFFNMAVANTCTNQGMQFPPTLNSYTQWSCPDSTMSVIPDEGIADIEPNVSKPALPMSEIAQLRQAPGLGTVFGVPVTLNLYRALQTAQGLTADDAQAHVPSLTSIQIRGLYSGGIVDWFALTSSVFGTPLPATPGVTPPTNAAAGGQLDSNVFICRRVSNSGVQASFETHWFQQRCDAIRGSTAPVSFLAPDIEIIPHPPDLSSEYVHASESASELRACMNLHNTNGTWAIGTLSTEVTLSQLASGNFRMIKVDGALPNLASVANGDYGFFTENVLVRRNVSPLPDPRVLPLLQFIEGNLGHPMVLRLINVGSQGRPWGDGGLLSIPTNLNPPNTSPQVDGSNAAGQMRARPVNTSVRSAVNNIVNNCNPPVMVGPSPIP